MLRLRHHALLLLAGLLSTSLLAAAGGPVPVAEPSPAPALPAPSREQLAAERERRVRASTEFALGQQAEEDGRLQAALEHYDRALGADPGFAQTKIRKAGLLYRLNRFDEGIRLLEETRKHLPPRADLEALLALGYLQRNERSLAQESTAKALDRIKEEETSDVTYYLRIGDQLTRLLIELRDSTPEDISRQVLPIFEKAAALETRSPQLLFRIAEMAMQVRDYPKAVSYYTRTESLQADFPFVRERLAIAHLANNNEPEAVKILEKIVADEPERKGVYPLLAEIYERLGQLQKAEDNLLIAIRLGADTPQNSVQLAILQLRNKKAEAAATTALEAQTKFPTIPQLSFIRAVALRASKKYTEALSSFQAASQIAQNDPSFLNSNFFFEWGATFEQAGQIPEAVEKFRQSLRIEPRNHMTLNYLGYMWADRNENLDEAEQMIRTALELNPGNAAYLDSLGWVLYRRGLYKEALVYLTQSAEKMGDNPDPVIKDHLGDVHLKLGNLAAAVDAWKKALALAEPSEKARIEAKIKAHEHRLASGQP
jgi:tetratricopeptide (TPR) repeat protein